MIKSVMKKAKGCLLVALIYLKTINDVISRYPFAKDGKEEKKKLKHRRCSPGGGGGGGVL